MDQAVQKLESALARLDGALDTLFAQAGDPTLLRMELKAMEQDRARLADELDSALGREAELQSLADEASAALGAAIEEVKAALAMQNGGGDGAS